MYPDADLTIDRSAVYISIFLRRSITLYYARNNRRESCTASVNKKNRKTPGSTDSFERTHICSVHHRVFIKTKKTPGEVIEITPHQNLIATRATKRQTLKFISPGLL